ncbi:MAG: YafY family transcriptional regulator [Candidatus Eremiobacteraeota bacterium]|nr:YafY family transcriptional regulator [Candidatus Eremiobacteraeota bacterium]
MKSDRLVSILLMLQSAQRRTARELAKALEVSERTIYRDVDALCASGIPVYTERGADGGIVLAEGYRKALTSFGEDEVRALFVSGSAILSDLGMGPGLERALDKLRGAFSDAQRNAAEKARGRIHIDQRRWNQSDAPVEKLSLLRRVIWDDRRIDLMYEDRKRERTTRTVDPFGLVSKAGVWYLVAQTDGGFRSFRVDRVVGITERDDRFSRPEDFDLDEHWRRISSELTMNTSASFLVTVRVEPDALDLVGSGYWPSEPVEGNPLLLRIRFANERVALSSIVSWGSGVFVVDPIELHAAIVEHARVLIRNYAMAAV